MPRRSAGARTTKNSLACSCVLAFARAREKRTPRRGIPRALASRMHALTFALKRAHHSFLAITRRDFDGCGLTAARFDLLYVVKGKSAGPSLIRQSDLRRALGVTAPTVSRMVKSLVALGFVSAKRAADDARQRV